MLHSLLLLRPMPGAAIQKLADKLLPLYRLFPQSRPSHTSSEERRQGQESEPSSPVCYAGQKDLREGFEL